MAPDAPAAVEAATVARSVSGDGLLGRRLHVVTGKGGTGKTTVAAALALALAGTGRKVLLVEVEGRQALSQLFDRSAMPYQETRLCGAGNGGELFGLAVDAEQAMIEYLDMFYGLKRSARGLRKIGAIDFVTTLAPGLRDVLLTGKVKESVVRKSGGKPVYDSVVLDAPPTGRIARFLDATQEVSKLTKFGPIKNQSDGVISLLHGPQTVVHLVTLLEEMPVQETVDAARELAGLGFALGTVIVNRVRPTLIGAGQVSDAGTVDRDALTAGLARAGLDAAQAGPLAAEMVQYAQRQRLQADNLTKLAQLQLTLLELPDLSPPIELGELKELAACFRMAA